MTDKTPLTNELTVSALISDAKNPAFYAALAGYVPTVWTLLHLPSRNASVAVGLFTLAGVLCGPLSTAAYALARAWHNSAHESRLARIESTVLASVPFVELIRPEVQSAVTTFLATLRAPAVLVRGPAGPPGTAGVAGVAGTAGAAGAKGEKGDVTLVQAVNSPSGPLAPAPPAPPVQPFVPNV